MLYRIDGIFIFLVALAFSIAQTSDNVLSYNNPPGEFTGFIKRYNVPFSGEGLSVCSWIKISGNDLKITYFKAYVRKAKPSIARLSGNANFKTSSLTALAQGENTNYSFTSAEDCNVKYSNSWFHVCTVSNQSSVNFYYNGFPAQNYVRRDDFFVDIKKNLNFYIGNTDPHDTIGSLYQANVFDRVITPDEAKRMHNCEHIAGDMISWNDITSKKKITFLENVKLEKDEMPCPNPPKYQPINCTKEKPVQTIPEKQDSSSGNLDPGSSSGSPSQGSGSGSPSQGSGLRSPSTGSDSGNPSTGSGSGSPNTGSGSGNPSTGSGSGNPSTGSDSGNPSPGSGLR